MFLRFRVFLPKIFRCYVENLLVLLNPKPLNLLAKHALRNMSATALSTAFSKSATWNTSNFSRAHSPWFRV